jgi:hypothetical protein
MRWRPFHLALILFQVFWLNIVVPGHTRGSVRMLGACCPDMSAASRDAEADCCPTHPERRPRPAQGAGCAICSFAAHLSVPPAVVTAPPRPMPLAVLPPERAESLIARVTLLPFDSCGPPANA